MQRGNGNIEGIAILAVLLVILVIAPKGTPDSNTSSSFSSSKQTSSDIESTETLNSLYTRSISLGAGNASRSYQAYEEYITISNSGREPITITNWYLKNAKDERPYNLGGDLRYFPADIAFIGKGTLFISPENNNVLQDIVLQAGEKAIVTTGVVGSQSPYKIVNFKENICSGYLGDMPEYKLTPALTRRCPNPEDEPGVNYLDIECRKFIDRMSSCRTPEFDTRDSDGEICYGCVDGKLLSSACTTFIKNHFNYNSCIANHKNDPKFSGKTWRIFLGHGWEMWATEYETIKLFDQFGKLVKSRSY